MKIEFNNWLPENWGRGKRVVPKVLKVVNPKPQTGIRFKAVGIQQAMNAFVPKGTQPLKAWDPNHNSYGGWVEISKDPFASGQGFIRKLKKRGYVVLGNGHYSTVLAKGLSSRVIKVCHNPTGDAWMDYCLWGAQKGYAGTFTPKVYTYKKFKNFYVAIMERMEYTAYHHLPEKKLYTAPYLLQTAIERKCDEADMLLDLLMPGCKKFTQDFRDGWKEASLDLHSGNIMFRADGGICITDPVCHQSKLQVNRLRASDFGLPKAV